MDAIKAKIRSIPDFPKPGIIFRDITPLLKDPETLVRAVQHLVEPFGNHSVTAIAGMEARGFIFGTLAAAQLGVGFVPLRKPGKLPHQVESASYALEYGSASLEIHVDALDSSDRVLLVDDLIATGGTAAASCKLVERLGATITGCAFLIELDALGGRDKLAKHTVHSLLHY